MVTVNANSIRTRMANILTAVCDRSDVIAYSDVTFASSCRQIVPKPTVRGRSRTEFCGQVLHAVTRYGQNKEGRRVASEKTF